MIGMAAAGWRGRGRGGRWATEALILGRAPVELVLSRALRRLARARPEVFERLGPWREAAVVVAPDDLPVGFRLQPDGERGAVRVVRKDDAAPAAARISGPLTMLLELFDGDGDADSAFFSRSIRIDGDTAAVVALHNTLEAADLGLADLLGAPAPLHGPINRTLSRVRRGRR